MQEELKKKILELENKIESFKKPFNIYSINFPAKNMLVLGL